MLVDVLQKHLARPLVRRSSQANRFLTRFEEALKTAPLVEERWRYVADHVARRDLGVYRLAAGGETVCLRHPHAGADPLALTEIFDEKVYELPARAAEELRGHDGPVIDVGGNIGLSALWFGRVLPGRPITSFEPDPDNVRVLKRCAMLNRRSWTIIAAAASNYDGSARFQAGRAWESRIDESGDAEVPVIDLFPHLIGASLLKLDIEGGEWPILLDPRFASLEIPVIVLEFHRHLCPSNVHPRVAARKALEGAGYTVHPGEEYEDGKGLLWGFKSPDVPAAIPLAA